MFVLLWGACGKKSSPPKGGNKNHDSTDAGSVIDDNDTNRDDNNNSSSYNQWPVAHAGNDQIVNESELVALDASSSIDEDDPLDHLQFTWKQISGHQVILENPSQIKTTFTSPTLDISEDSAILVFQLTVSDGHTFSDRNVDGTNTSTDTVTITVNNVNLAPNADAGEDQSVFEGEQVIIDASNSSDPDTDELHFSILQKSGPTVTTTATLEKKFVFTAPYIASQQSQTLTFEITVTDVTGKSDSDTVTIEIKNKNKPPVVDAGMNQIKNEEEVTNLNCKASDPDDDTLSYHWKRIDTRTEKFTIAGDTSSTASFTAPTLPASEASAEFVFRCTVKDSAETKSDTVTITVNNVNQPPTIAAIQEQEAIKEVLFQLDLSSYINDPDNDEIIIYIDNGTSGMNITDSLFSWTPSVNELGINTITIRASDGTASMNMNFSVNVTGALLVWHDFEKIWTKTYQDISSNANDATLMGAVPNDGRFESGITLNGTSQYISIPDAISLNPSAMLTLEAWVYVSNFSSCTGDWCGIINKGNNAGWQFLISKEGALQFKAIPSDSAAATVSITSANNTITEKKWFHVAATMNKTDVQLFIDGKLDKEKTITLAGIKKDTSALLIGKGSNTSYFFAGNLDDIKIFEEVRTQKQICKDANGIPDNTGGCSLPSSPRSFSGQVLYISGDARNSYAELVDQSGSGFTIAASGITFVPGKVRQAIQMDGSQSYLQVANNGKLNPATDISIETWIYIDSYNNCNNTNNGKCVIATKDGASTGYRFALSNEGLITFTLAATTQYNPPYSLTTDNADKLGLQKWHHIAAVYDSSKMKIFIDGELKKSMTAVGSILSNTNALIIGKGIGNTSFFEGKIDDFRLFNTTRSQKNICLDAGGTPGSNGECSW